MAHIRKLKSGKWQATIRHPSGERFSRSDRLKVVVKKWADDQEAAIRRGEWVNPHSGQMPLKEWRGKWLLTRRWEIATREKTDSWWRRHIAPKFADWPIASIQSWDVEAWVSELEAKGVGAVTVQSSLRLLRQILKAAVKHNLIPANPAADVAATRPDPHVDRILTRGEAEKLLEQFKDRDRVFVEVLLYCGLRFQEAAGLRRFRVDLLRKRINVVRVQPRKGDEKRPKTDAGVRPVPLTDELVIQLSQLIPAPNDGLVFAPSRGKRIWYTSWMRDKWYPAVARAQLSDPQPTPHDLRHTYGSWLADDNVPPHEIAALMGHGSLKSVERYIHASETRFERARAALQPRAAGERQEQLPQAHPDVPK